jgi:glucose/arabinose dehydrogenase
VNGHTPYGIPPTNPFVGRLDGRLETYAYGFRNPYRFSFDRTSGDLLVGDAGQNLWEEVSRVTRGGNYGWNRREGAHCFNPANPNQSPATCTNTGPFGELLLDPVIEYANANNPAGGTGIAVVGGYVYRGSALGGFDGRYIFGDFSRSFLNADARVWVATTAQDGPWSFHPLPFGDRGAGSLGHFLKGFGEDSNGELYLLTSDRAGPSGTTGRVYRLVPHTP